jgi:hypothetical protein
VYGEQAFAGFAGMQGEQRLWVYLRRHGRYANWRARVNRTVGKRRVSKIDRDCFVHLVSSAQVLLRSFQFSQSTL